MNVSFFNPDDRARAKAASRRKDDDDLRSGRISREELNLRNGGYGLMRGAKLVRKRIKRNLVLDEKSGMLVEQ